MLLVTGLRWKLLEKQAERTAALAKLVPKVNHVVLKTIQLKHDQFSDLQLSDLIRVQAGEKRVRRRDYERGESDLNETLLTGESKAVKKGPGDEVIKGLNKWRRFFILKW